MAKYFQKIYYSWVAELWSLIWYIRYINISFTLFSKPTGSKPTFQTVPRKPLYLTLQYKSDNTSEETKRKLKAAIARTFPAAELRLRFKYRGYNLANEGINSSTLSTLYAVYQFTCSCEDKYIGRTERCLSRRIAEHISKYLRSLMNWRTPTTHNVKRNPTSSIAKHILDTWNKVDPETSFGILLHNHNLKVLQLCGAFFN